MDKTYKISYSSLDTSYQYVTDENGDEIIFSVPIQDSDTINEINFYEDSTNFIICRYLKIHPVTWNNHISGRFDIIHNDPSENSTYDKIFVNSNGNQRTFEFTNKESYNYIRLNVKAYVNTYLFRAKLGVITINDGINDRVSFNLGTYINNIEEYSVVNPIYYKLFNLGINLENSVFKCVSKEGDLGTNVALFEFIEPNVSFGINNQSFLATFYNAVIAPEYVVYETTYDLENYRDDLSSTIIDNIFVTA